MTERFVRHLLLLFVASIPLLCWSVELGVALTLSHLLGMALVATAAVVWLRERRPIPFDWAWLGVVAFLVVAAVSVARVRIEPDIQMLGESAHAKAVKQLIGLLFGFAVFGALRLLLSWYGLALTALRAHFWVTAAVAVLALGQYAIAAVDIQHPLANITVHNSTFGVTRGLSLMYGFPRVSLTLIEPSMLATYLMTGWAFWLFSWDRSPFETSGGNVWSTAGGIVLGVAIIASGSRMAYVVLVTLTAVAIAVRPRRFLRVVVVAASVGLGVVATGPEHARSLVASLAPRPAPPSAPVAARPSPAPATAASPGRLSAGEARSGVRESTSSVVIGPTPGAAAVDQAMDRTAASVTRNDVSVQQRVASYLVAADVVRQRPWLGTGFGTSAFYMERHWPATFIPLPVDRLASATMMSHYATVLTETGLVGAMCVLVFAVGVVARLWACWRANPSSAGTLMAVGAALAGYAIASTATALVVYQNLLVWLLLAVAVSLHHHRWRGPDGTGHPSASR